MLDQVSERPDITAVLQTVFGFSGFRENQEAIILRTLEQKDSVVLMPTGGGKSLCYQIPALLNPGVTVVISPLIALMKDQVQNLTANGIDATFLNSSLEPEVEARIIAGLKDGQYKILYVAPERLFSNGFMDFLSALNVSLFAIDEAHCISTWGHHFRPDYKNLAQLKDRYPDVPVMALTATADRAVRQDIAEILKLKDPAFFVSSFDRENLSLAVLPGQKKWEQLVRIIKKYPDESGIIYCSSRKGTEDLAAKLRKHGFDATSYHAGLDPVIRSKTQDDFLTDEVKIVCATIAFGMGIDKAAIRFVIHYNMPGNLESLYQEIGRAGRDGEPAETVLFYSYRDVQTHMGFIEEVDDEAYKSILLAKLSRIQEYAEAQICRRKILLSYFSEIPGEDCGNCDVCHNPPQYKDGTVEAQKVISAVIRSREKLPLSTLVDVLKGHYSAAVKENQWHTLKTFGAGRELTPFAWQLYVQQMIQQGIIEIDYRSGSCLKTNELSQEVLQGKAVRLVDFDTIKRRQEEQKHRAAVRAPREAKEILALPVDEGLFEQLKKLRRQIAEEIGKPPYIVFSDLTLRDMSARKPRNMGELMLVNGVGAYKADLYGKRFLGLINAANQPDS